MQLATQCRRIDCPLSLARLPSVGPRLERHAAGHDGEDEEDQEDQERDKEQYLGNGCCRCRNAGKAQKSCDNRDDEKDESPFQHGVFLRLELGNDWGSENATPGTMFQAARKAAYAQQLAVNSKHSPFQGFCASSKFHIVEWQTVANARRILAGSE